MSFLKHGPLGHHPNIYPEDLPSHQSFEATSDEGYIMQLPPIHRCQANLPVGQDDHVCGGGGPGTGVTVVGDMRVWIVAHTAFWCLLFVLMLGPPYAILVFSHRNELLLDQANLVSRTDFSKGSSWSMIACHCAVKHAVSASALEHSSSWFSKGVEFSALEEWPPLEFQGPELWFSHWGFL